jgi:type II secretory pathway component PulM
MEKRFIAIAGAVGALALAGVWWWLGSPAEVVTQKDQERLDTLKQMEAKVVAVAAERGTSWSPEDLPAPRPEVST